jgi:pimeloyl-ACP methyl ester carboxylesterase
MLCRRFDSVTQKIGRPKAWYASLALIVVAVTACSTPATSPSGSPTPPSSGNPTLPSSGNPTSPSTPAADGPVPIGPYAYADGSCPDPPWNAVKAPERSQLPAQSDIPILILAGELDGVTAPANAELATPTLPNAGVLSFPDSGHGVLDQSTCGSDTVTGFLNDPKRDYRPACLAGLKAPTFATTTG